MTRKRIKFASCCVLGLLGVAGLLVAATDDDDDDAMGLLAGWEWVSNTQVGNQVDVNCPIGKVLISGHCSLVDGSTLTVTGASGTLLDASGNALIVATVDQAVGFRCTNNSVPTTVITAVALCCPSPGVGEDED